jgi:hypothetical protein
MKLSGISAAIAVCLSACTMLYGVAPAVAGYWNYGCEGSLGSVALVFDRDTFQIMPKALAKGDIAGLTGGEIFAFDAADNDSGFMPVMKFARGAFPDQKIVLTEKSSKKVSEQSGHVGSRERTTTNYRKTYHYQRLGWSDSPDEADIVMECIEYELTAP